MSDGGKPIRWVGFDLGGTKMMATVFDEKFRPLGSKRKRTKGHEGVDACLARMKAVLRHALDEAKLEPADITGMGIGCPGPVDFDGGVVLDAVNLGWQNVPLRKLMRDEFRCPVAVLNDVDAGVYGEYRFGAAKAARCAIGIFPGTGIGGGGVYDGQIIRGKKCSAMEIGHVQVNPTGKLCGCGFRGCLETEASRLAIAGEVAKAAYRGDAPHLMKNVGTNLAEIRSGALADSIKAGDVVVEEIVRTAASQIGKAAAAVVHLLGPDVIVLGGGLVEAMSDLFVSVVSHSINHNVMPPYVNSFKVVPAKLKDDAAVMGAAAWAEKVAAQGA
ncbi:MAG: ROK family protein [Planctomycetales bacterium]|nr:ROK family protein [Planctomycetales bacterium]MCA9163157.1 ROK family protein [Planctomycetales bacterium]MCA9202312.1 ROK family protein [Planctomycetales bacterium]MCA9208529.1 ROK family protein [Planctomycetales bacterium]MCA9220695.1 ROK family protein [Planctomycetales bacterium]